METFIATQLIKAEVSKQGDYYAKYHPECFVPQSMQWYEEQGYITFNEQRNIGWITKDQFEKNHIKLEINSNLQTSKPSISQQMVNDFIVDYDVFTKHEKITLVIATLKNGFTLVESSACVSLENYNEEMGASICKKRIVNQVWNYLGFLLQTAVGNSNDGTKA